MSKARNLSKLGVNTSGSVDTSTAIADSSIALSKIARTGTAGQVLMSGGAGADPAYATLNVVVPVDIQTFNSTGTWTKPTGGQTMACVQIWGGGGGVYHTGSGGHSGAGGGGYNEVTVPLSYLASTVTATIGAGGVGNANGGTSSFTLSTAAYGLTSWTATGGGTGPNYGCGAQGVGGKPNGIGVADSAFTGGLGDNTSNEPPGVIYGGGGGAGPGGTIGGKSLYGGAGGAQRANGVAPGGGGGGGVYPTTSTTTGGAGRIIVTCW